MNVYLVDGPYAGQTFDVPDGLKYFRAVGQESQLRYSPDDLVMPVDYMQYEYSIEKLCYSIRWEGGSFVAVAKIGVLEKIPLGLDWSKLDWEYKEVIPDFEHDFEGWFKNRLAVHAPWTLEYQERPYALEDLKYKTSNPRLRIN